MFYNEKIRELSQKFFMIKCSYCGIDIEKPIASIAGSIMGDEYIDSYYFCDKCQFYTVECLYNKFLGQESVRIKGPISKTDGDDKIKIIKNCTEPWNKKCRCQAHLEYFGNVLD